MSKKIAIISTAEARTIIWGNLPLFEIKEAKPSLFLLELITRGYQIFVVGSRTVSGITEHDNCWMDLIPKEQILFNKSNNGSEIIDCWRKVFALLDLFPPQHEEDWLDWKIAAQSQGIVTYRKMLPPLNCSQCGK